MGYWKVCIGIDLEDGVDVSFCNDADENQGLPASEVWSNEADIVVAKGENARVFDGSNNLIKKFRDVKIEELIKEISEFVEEQGTLPQDERFEEVVVCHLTKRDHAIDGDVIMFIGQKAVFCESGSTYYYTELDDVEIIEIADIVGIN